MKYDYILAIDPDCDKSGAVVLRTADKYISCECLAFPKLLDHLRFCADMAKKGDHSLIAVVEAGWLNASHWHHSRDDSRSKVAALGNAVGRNHETGRKIVEMCRHYGIKVDEVMPLKKVWRGKDGKITQEEISQFIPKFPVRANQEVRDAALLAWNYSGFPIRMKPIK